MTTTGKKLAYSIYVKPPVIYVENDLLRTCTTSDKQECWVELFDKQNLSKYKNCVGTQLMFNCHWPIGSYIYTEVACTVGGCSDEGFFQGTSESFCVLCTCTLMLSHIRSLKFGVICAECREKFCIRSGWDQPPAWVLRPENEGLITIHSDYERYFYRAYDPIIKGDCPV